MHSMVARWLRDLNLASNIVAADRGDHQGIAHTLEAGAVRRCTDTRLCNLANARRQRIPATD